MESSTSIGGASKQSGVSEALVWLRVPGDVVFAAGTVILAVYALRLLRSPGKPATELAPSGAK